MRIVPVILAALGALGVAAASSPARAEWDDHDGWHQHEWRERQSREQRWHEHEWRERQWRGYAPAPAVVYAPPPAAYYAPLPPPYYAAPPAAYYPPPPPQPVYEAPGVSIGFSFR